MLTSKGGRTLLHDIRLVILDEVHAVVGSKRGTHLATAIERVAHRSGEFQRIALSATVHPAEEVARFVGGYRADGTPRPVAIVRPTLRKDVALEVEPLPPAPSPESSTWEVLAHRLLEIIDRNRSVVIFVNSRRLSETLAAQINKLAEADEPVAYAHHGSLARDVRLDVEQRLKAGRLKAIVATSTLEMGIDIGELDEVILVQAPHSVASATQRIGRAGHNVGDTSRGTLMATHARDLLELAVLGHLVITNDLEAVVPLEQPLDVLTQVILSMVIDEEWHLDDVYAVVRASYPYRTLSRPLFDSVIAMLCGRYEHVRVRELKPRITVDTERGTAVARRGAAQLLYANGGTIPDRGLYHMRHAATRERLGELDEEFVWENGPGSRFAFGNSRWIVERVTHSDVWG